MIGTILSCNHDIDLEIQEIHKQYEEQRTFQDPSTNRILENTLVSQVAPIRVTANMISLNDKIVTPFQRKYITSIVKSLTNFLSKFLKVIPNRSNNIFMLNGSLSTCFYNQNIPLQDLSSGIPNSDLHLYISYDQQFSDLFVSAGWCSFTQSQGSFRPNFGRMKFSLGSIPLETDSTPFIYQRNFEKALHQAIHVLGFSGDSIKFWIDKQTKKSYDTSNIDKIISFQSIGQFNSTILFSEQVLKTARKYYNCSTLPGVVLQKQAIDSEIGSHWELTILNGDIMTPSLFGESTHLSIFTIAALKDTGFWSDVNENFASEFFWGKGKGCDFFTKSCNSDKKFEEFSNATDLGCTFLNDGEGISTKDSDQYCFYLKPSIESICTDPSNNRNISSSQSARYLDEFGFDSKCFESSLFQTSIRSVRQSFTRCHRFECSADRSSVKIISSIYSDFFFDCLSEYEGTTQKVYKKDMLLGTVTCPKNYKKFCANKKCKNFCSSNGICIKGYCLCNQGYSSEDCSLPCPAVSENGYCVNACSPGKYANPDNTCKTTCPEGYFPSKKSCVLCDFSCSKCTGPSKNECTACQFLTFLQQNTCVESCSAGYYLDDKNSLCEPCPAGCLTCISDQECLSCDQGNGFKMIGKICTNCQLPCTRCLQNNTSLCTDCQLELNLFNQTCVKSCPDMFFKDQKNHCQPCLHGCLVCETSTTCLLCDSKNKFKLYDLLNANIKVCIKQTDCFQPCAECDIPWKPQKCKSCIKGFKLQSSTCLENCYQGFLADENWICQKCSQTCRTCQGQSSYCTSCNDPLSLSFNQCVSTCPEGEVSIENICAKLNSAPVKITFLLWVFQLILLFL